MSGPPGISSAASGVATHLGSGLWIGRAKDEEPKLRATREGPHRYRAEIVGIKDETVVHLWSAIETYPTAAEALANSDTSEPQVSPGRTA